MLNLEHYLEKVKAVYPDAILENGSILFTDEKFDFTLNAALSNIGVTLYVFNIEGSLKKFNDVDSAWSLVFDPNTGNVSLLRLIGPEFSGKDLTDAVETLKSRARELLLDQAVALAWH